MTATAAAPDVHKVKALELANMHPATPGEVVTRAQSYHAFLSGGAAPAATKAAATGGAPAGGKPNAADAPKGGAAPDPKAAAAAKAAAATKAAAEAAAKAKAAAGAGTGGKAPAAGAAPKAASGTPANQKAAGGKYSYTDVVQKLTAIRNRDGDTKVCYQILDQHGGGVKNIQNLKPEHYDAVVAAAEAALKPAPAAAAAEADPLDPLGDPPEHTSAGLDAEMDPTAGPARDDMGLA